MDLQEFIQDQKDLIDEFAYQYEERRKRGKERTLFRSEQQWVGLLEEFLSYRREMLDGESETEKAA